MIAELEKVPPAERTGRLFPWGPKSAGSVYKRLEPLCAALGLEFTPHCARHSFATNLHDEGASLMDLLEVGSWTSLRAIERYIAVRPARARAVLGLLVAEVGDDNGREAAKGGTRGVTVPKRLIA